MLLVHGIAAHLLLNRKERTTAVLYLIRSLGVTALLNLPKKDRIPYFLCSHDSSPITFNSNALLSKNEAGKIQARHGRQGQQPYAILLRGSHPIKIPIALKEAAVSC